MTSNLAQVLKTKKMARGIGKLSTTEQAKLKKLYTSGPAAYGSPRNLQETSKKPKAKIDIFLQEIDARTKYRQSQIKFPPTYNLRDESGDTINGKFYEPELVKVNGRI